MGYYRLKMSSDSDLYSDGNNVKPRLICVIHKIPIIRFPKPEKRLCFMEQIKVLKRIDAASGGDIIGVYIEYLYISKKMILFGV